MPYHFPLGGTSRQLTPLVTIHSCPFTRGPVIKFGARMALIKLPNTNVVVWSALPYGPEAELCFASIGKHAKVSNVIIPDFEHTMAARDYVNQFPGVSVVGMEGVDESRVTPLTGGKFTAEHANKVLKGSELAQILKGENAQDLVDNFEFVYVPGHQNHELVMFHPESKTLFEADLLFNIQPKSEQYGNINPTTGLSFIARYLQPYSKVGNWLLSKIIPVSEGNKQGLAAIASWEFERIVMCHGEVIEGKQASKLAFDAAFAGHYK
ncbi:hypothetical protein BABINDRAFT_7622 [Babjeviella inositovora NRRL Y-12698]|uniref:Metallo-beta-lactamase domain-containing protein n=1 Tax=Babjeviella inositovora NRRL Y-12698 TaxID=984486 RepID=A0A1E3QRM2_9ASCO|nr:uncharacterized protein BABINDRAFT_7622 [Babjeviella inositovora NRRL Y-12698]ODQ80144.1 hypothetical protein BABINDRAFT_7622 [Babjeviella inositovora NRRL Y-12698]